MADLLDRILDKIHFSDDGCWPWTAAVKVDGYGGIWIDGRVELAHRAVYELLVEPIPPGLQIDHLCRNQSCVNPDHLEPVTPGENTRRGRSANREKTHCPRGHAYTEDNTYRSGGRRYCRTCIKARTHRSPQPVG